MNTAVAPVAVVWLASGCVVKKGATVAGGGDTGGGATGGGGGEDGDVGTVTTSVTELLIAEPALFAAVA